MKKFISIAAVLILFASCYPMNDWGRPVVLNDITDQTGYYKLRTLAYMGGSVYYDDSDLKNSIIVSGAKIAFRLGKTEEHHDSPDGIYYTDIPEQARYGLLEIEAVSRKEISILFDLYDSKSNLITSGKGTIPLNQAFDIDNDGLDDLDYRKPYVKRPGLEEAVHLNFLSSKEDNRTSMFSVIPAQYYGRSYPNGVLGVNPDGRFIFSKFQEGNTTRSLIKGFIPGDYVLDSQKGSYERVNMASYGSARSFTEEDLIDVDATETNVVLFQSAEFTGYSAIDLLNRVLSDLNEPAFQGTEETAIDYLNTLLSDVSLATRLENKRPGPIPTQKLAEVLANLPSLPLEHLQYFNRMYIQTSYPDYSPALNIPENPISEIFPLLSVEVAEAEGLEAEASESAGSSRAFGTAKTSSEYDVQRAAIVNEWKKFKSVYSITYDSFPQFIKDMSMLGGAVGDFFKNWGREEPGKKATGDFQVDPVTGEAKASGYNPFDEFIISTVKFFQPLTGIGVNEKDEIPESEFIKIVKADKEGVIKLDGFNFGASIDPPHKAVELSLGLLGKFSSTWGNIESSVGLATYLSLDSNFSAKASYNNNGNNSTALTLLDLPIPLGKTPPIIIGPVAISLSLQAGFKLPISLNVSANMRLGYRVAFSGIYGATATAGFNYGISWAKRKVLWWTISVPDGGYVKPYGSAGILNQTAFYVGPDDFLVIPTMPVITGAEASISVTPTIYIDGRILFWDWLYFGARAEAGEEFSFITTVKPKSGQWMPVVKGTTTASHFWRANVDAGMSFVIPIINWRIDPKFTIWSSPTQKYEWARWDAFKVGE